MFNILQDSVEVLVVKLHNHSKTFIVYELLSLMCPTWLNENGFYGDGRMMNKIIVEESAGMSHSFGTVKLIL